MRKILFDTATTLNGWIADEPHSLQWLFDVPDGGSAQGLVPDAAVLVEGSGTYEWLLRESDLLAHPERWQEFHGARPTFVFTTRTLPVPEGADIRFVSGADALPQILSVAPVVLTGGAPLLPRRVESDRLRLIESRAVGQFARLRYEVVRPG